MHEALRKTRSSKGFTLVELMIILAIIGILGAILYASLTGNGTSGSSFGPATNADAIQAVRDAGGMNPRVTNSWGAFDAPSRAPGCKLGDDRAFTVLAKDALEHKVVYNVCARGSGYEKTVRVAGTRKVQN